jgi:hypothetical protein
MTTTTVGAEHIARLRRGVGVLLGAGVPINYFERIGATYSFTGAFLIAGVVLVVGIAACVVLLGALVPIADQPAGG